jgi:diguanylate cyclase (GGDEF)-like protein
MKRIGTNLEDSETHFWLRTVAVGGWVTILMSAAGGAYVAAFAEPGERLGLAVLVAVTGLLGAAALWLVPWRRVVASQWREAAFFTWSALTIGIVAAVAAIDGGARSPLVLALVLPAVFASLALSFWRVALIGLLAELAFLGLALIGSPGAGNILVFCAVLSGTITMAVGQSGLHQEWRSQLARSSRTDPLTGLLNRRGLATAATSGFDELTQGNRQLTLLLLDLDLFKSYNDTHGHQAGDELLCWVAAQLGAAARPCDAVARLGGDEFALLLPGADRAAAEPVIGALLASLSRRIPCSIGRATAPEDGTSFDDLFRTCDSSLYRRKLRHSEEQSPAAAVPRGEVLAASAS